MFGWGGGGYNRFRRGLVPRAVQAKGPWAGPLVQCGPTALRDCGLKRGCAGTSTGPRTGDTLYQKAPDDRATKGRDERPSVKARACRMGFPRRNAVSTANTCRPCAPSHSAPPLFKHLPSSSTSPLQAPPLFKHLPSSSTSPLQAPSMVAVMAHVVHSPQQRTRCLWWCLTIPQHALSRSVGGVLNHPFYPRGGAGATCKAHCPCNGLGTPAGA